MSARQLPTGTILVEPPVVSSGRTVAYCRVSSVDQRDGLERQAGRVAQECGERGITLDATITEIGSGLNGRRVKVRKLLADPMVTRIVVEHRDRRVAPWWADNSKEAYSCGLANLAVALQNWDESRRGKRRGRKIRFPRFKGKRAGMSCRFTTGAFGLAGPGRRHVRLPRIGMVRTLESTRKLARHVQRGTARVRSATVSHRAGRWFVSLSVQITRHDPAPTQPDTAVGVDLGVKSLAVLSTGEVDANPQHLETAQRQLRVLQRQAARRIGPDQRTGQTPSQRWRTTQARIAKLHTRVTNARRDGLHKLTTRLVHRRYAGHLLL